MIAMGYYKHNEGYIVDIYQDKTDVARRLGISIITLDRRLREGKTRVLAQEDYDGSIMQMLDITESVTLHKSNRGASKGENRFIRERSNL